MARNYIVYQSRNRITGTLCQTLDTKHVNSDLPFIAEKRYAARCVEHGKVMRFKEHYFAGRAIAHVDEWCKRCQTMLARGKRIANKRDMKFGVETSKPDHADMRMAANNNAHDKRWRNGNVKRDVKSEAQRANDQAGIYIGTDREKESV